MLVSGRGSLQRTIFCIAKKAPESSVADAFGVTVRRSQCNRSPRHSAGLMHHPTAHPAWEWGAHWGSGHSQSWFWKVFSKEFCLDVTLVDTRLVFHTKKIQHLVEELVTPCMWISGLKNVFSHSNNTSSKKNITMCEMPMLLTHEPC